MADNKNFNLFHVRMDDPAEYQAMDMSEFESASADEKEKMVNERKSVSYWADAWRRFKSNTVSMVALGVFIVILLFAFVGPYLIPYSYEEQYRSAMKLGPFEYSDMEQAVIDLLEENDLVYSTSMQVGSMTAISKNKHYYFDIDGKTYALQVEKSLEKVIILYNADAEEPLTYLSEKDLEAEPMPLAWTTDVPEDAILLTMSDSVFPHVFGTDSAGRDIMSRTMYGARVSLIIGIVAALIVLVIGATYGAVAGSCGGTVDFIMMRIVDLIYSIPDVLIVLLLQVVMKDPLREWFDASTNPLVNAMGELGVGIVSIFITFAMLYWVGMARIIRGQVLTLKAQEYVTAATALGVSRRKIITCHLLPNCIGQLIIATCLQIPSAIFLESFLSFLGLGVSAPMASLGSMCSDAIETITLYPYRLLFPAIILTVLVLSLNLVGDGLRDALDPRLKK